MLFELFAAKPTPAPRAAVDVSSVHGGDTPAAGLTKVTFAVTRLGGPPLERGASVLWCSLGRCDIYQRRKEMIPIDRRRCADVFFGLGTTSNRIRGVWFACQLFLRSRRFGPDIQVEILATGTPPVRRCVSEGADMTTLHLSDLSDIGPPNLIEEPRLQLGQYQMRLSA